MRRLVIVLAVVVCLGAACSEAATPPGPVTEAQARRAMDRLVTAAASRTPAAMRQVCRWAETDDCGFMSGAIRNDDGGPASAPGPDRPPEVRCSRDVGRGGWMVVVEGVDGRDRSYVSQIVFARDPDGRIVTREPAFWLGIGYAGEDVMGSAGWSAAYHPSGLTDPAFTAKVLARAEAACDR